MKAVRQSVALAFMTLIMALFCMMVPSVFPFAEKPQRYLSDIADTIRGSRVPDPSGKVVLITITDDSLDLLPHYTSPYDQGKLADVLELVESASPKVIGIDLLFDRPTEEEKQRRLQTTIKNSKTPIVLATAEKSDGLTDKQKLYLDKFIEEVEAKTGSVRLNKKDEIVRSIRHTANSPSFAGAIAKLAGIDVLDGLLSIEYRQNPEGTPFNEFLIHELVDDQEMLRKWFEGKIVLIGTNIQHQDRHAVPISAGSQTIPGLVIHAHVVDQLVEGRMSRHLSKPATLAVILVFCIAGMALAVWGIPLLSKYIVGITLSIGIWLFSFSLVRFFDSPNLPMLWSSIGFLGTWGAGSIFLSYAYRSERSFIRSAFSHYLDPKIVSNLLQSPDDFDRLRSGEKQTLTFLFTDIADFTSHAESLTPESLVHQLNEYLDLVSKIIIEHGGTVDKFIGDAVVAFFGAPTYQEDHAQRAVDCACSIQEELNKIEDSEVGLFQLGRTRIGIHTGEAVVGNIGGRERVNYTVVGDPVNTAARLEGANKYLGTSICVSKRTQEKCNTSKFRAIGELQLKGKSSTLMTFEPLTAATQVWVDQYLEAFHLLETNPSAALDTFRKLTTDYPDDPLVHLHLDRLTSGKEDQRIVLEEK